MTTEQKEAIEKLQQKLNPKEFGGYCVLGYNQKYCFGKSEVEAIETVLNLIQEQEKEIEKKDNAIKKIINRLNNDIIRISKSKTEKYSDDYRRCRLKAYKTKTKEIKEYIEKQYFERKVEDESNDKSTYERQDK